MVSTESWRHLLAGLIFGRICLSTVVIYYLLNLRTDVLIKLSAGNTSNYIDSFWFLVVFCLFVCLFFNEILWKGFPGGSDGKKSAYSAGDLSSITRLGRCPVSSILVWKIPWTEEPDRLKSMGSQRVECDSATNTSLHRVKNLPKMLSFPSLIFLLNHYTFIFWNPFAHISIIIFLGLSINIMIFCILPSSSIFLCIYMYSTYWKMYKLDVVAFFYKNNTRDPNS